MECAVVCEGEEECSEGVGRVLMFGVVLMCIIKCTCYLLS